MSADFHGENRQLQWGTNPGTNKDFDTATDNAATDADTNDVNETIDTMARKNAWTFLCHTSIALCKNTIHQITDSASCDEGPCTLAYKTPALKWMTAIVSAFDLVAGVLLVMLKTRARLKDGNCECAKRFCATKPGTKSLFVTTRICFRVTAFFGWIFLFVFEAHILNLVKTLRDAHCVDITDARHTALSVAACKEHSLIFCCCKMCHCGSRDL